MPILVAQSAAVATPGSGSVPYTYRVLSIGDVAMSNGSGMLDQFGIRWLLQEVTGWDGSPATTGELTQRASDHGSWAPAAYLPSRVIGVAGSFLADWGSANAAIGRLAAAIPVSTLAPVVVTGGGPDLQAMVRQEGELLVAQAGATTNFSFSLVAPDPRRYSTEVDTLSTNLPQSTGGLSIGAGLSLPLTVNATAASGLLSVTNDGNFPTRPMLTVVGPCPPGSATHLGSSRRLRWPEAVPAGRSLLIDTDRRRALLDGTAPRVVTGSWFEYAPGDNEVAFSATSYDPAAQLISTSRSTWR
jgi:hypothetical protein